MESYSHQKSLLSKESNSQNEETELSEVKKNLDWNIGDNSAIPEILKIGGNI